MNEIHIYLPERLNQDTRISTRQTEDYYITKPEFWNKVKGPIEDLLNKPESPIQTLTKHIGGIHTYLLKSTKEEVILAPSFGYLGEDQKVIWDSEKALKFVAKKTLIMNIPKQTFTLSFKNFQGNSYIQRVNRLITFLVENRVPYFMLWDENKRVEFIAGNNKDAKIFIDKNHKKLSENLEKTKYIFSIINQTPFEKIIAQETIKNLYQVLKNSQ